MAMASASELEYLLLLASELGMIPPHAYAALESQVKEVKRMLTSLIQRVRADIDQANSVPTERRRLTADT
jgi:four helix bundle protein